MHPARRLWEEFTAAADETALSLLRQEGIDCVWELHTNAVRVYREGKREAAEWLVKIADLAEGMYRRHCLSIAGLDRPDRLGRLQP